MESESNVDVWKISLRPGGGAFWNLNDQEDIEKLRRDLSDFCKEKGILGIGWSLWGIHSYKEDHNYKEEFDRKSYDDFHENLIRRHPNISDITPEQYRDIVEQDSNYEKYRTKSGKKR